MSQCIKTNQVYLKFCQAINPEIPKHDCPHLKRDIELISNDSRLRFPVPLSAKGTLSSDSLNALKHAYMQH